MYGRHDVGSSTTRVMLAADTSSAKPTARLQRFASVLLAAAALIAPVLALAGGSSLSLGTSGSPSTFGTSVTFTATLTGVSKPSGTDTFCADATTTNSSCTGGTVLCSLPVDSNPVQCLTSTLAAGTHAITAFYSGDASNQSATSNTVSQTVNQGSTSTALASDINPSTAGQLVTFTATVNGQAPSGSVTFSDGLTPICTNVTLSGTSAACAVSTLSVATHSISAVYGSDANNTGSTSNTVMQQVTQAASSTTLVSSANPSTFNQSVTFTATISGASPGGTATFSDGPTTICPSVALNAGSAQCVISTLAVGSHSIKAVYGGDANNVGSTSNIVSQQVKAASSTTLNSSANPSDYAQSVTFTALVNGSSPSGTVAFKDGTFALCAAVPLNGGSAQCMLNNLAVGTHSITATYSGDTNNNTSTSPTVAQQVNLAPTSTSLQSSANPSTYSVSITFTATTSGQSPTGTITFNDGATVLCANAAVSANVATCMTNTLVTGLHQVSAVYNGDGNNATSTSNTVTQQVNRADTTTTLSTACMTTFVENQPFTVTAMVNGTNVSGGVNFLIDGATLACSNVPLVSNTADCTISNLASSGGQKTTYGIAANYPGDTNYRSSQSSTLLVHVLGASDVIFRSGFDAQTVQCPAE